MKIKIVASIFAVLVLVSGANLYGQVRTSVQNGLYNNATTWDCSCIPSSTDDVVIATGDTVALSNNTTVNNLTIQDSAQLNNNGRRIEINGNYTINGQHTGSGEIRLMGVNTVIDGRGEITNGSNFDIRANGITLTDSSYLIKAGGGSFRIRGANTFVNNGYFICTRDITGNNASSIFVNGQNATLYAGGNVMRTGQLNASALANTVRLNRSGFQRVEVPVGMAYHNLELAGSGTKRLQGNVIINGNMTLLGGTFNTNGNDIELKGSYSNNGGIYDASTGLLLLSGSDVQQISTNAVEMFNDFEVDKLSGSVVLHSGVEVENNLILSNGIINARSATLVLGTGTGNIGTLTRSGGHIIGSFSRWINTGTTTYLFPVGDGQNYTPATFDFTTIVNGQLNVRYIPQFPGSNGLPLFDSPDSLFNTFTEGYWRITDTSGLVGSVYNLELAANGFTSYTVNSSTRIVLRNGPVGPWQIQGSHNPAMVPAVFRNGLNVLGVDAAIADTTRCLLPSPSTSAIIGLDKVCKNANGSTYSVLPTPGSTYLWEISGGSQVFGGNSNLITVNWGSIGMEGYVKVTEYNGCEYGTPVILPVNIEPFSPSAIVGQATGYEGTTSNLYYIEEQQGYTYNWNVTGVGSRVGTGSNDSIYIDFNSAGLANIEVSLSNVCGVSDTSSLDVVVVTPIKSIATGSWTNTSTWDCSCNPGNNSSVQIRPGHTVTSGNNTERAYAVIIDSAATLNVTGNRIIIDNYLSNRGAITGSGEVRMGQSGSVITGTGSWIGHSGNIRFETGSHDITGDVLITKSSGGVQLRTDCFVFNGGAISSPGTMTGTATSSWIQQFNSVLEIGDVNWSSGNFDAQAVNNRVSYIGTGTFTRNVRTPDFGIYWQLEIASASAGGTYQLSGDVSVFSELTLSSGTLDASTSSFDINLLGDWRNTGATFNPRSAEVLFSGSNQRILKSSVENFFDFRLESPSSVLTLTDIDLANKLLIPQGASLDMNDTNSYQLSVGGDILIQGQISLHENLLLLDGTTNQSLKGEFTAYDLTLNNSNGAICDSATVSIRNVLDIDNGQFNANSNLVLLSGVNETARLADLTGGGTIIGNAKVQRYLNEGNGWYMLASPVTGSDLEDWNQEIYMSGFPGSDGNAAGFISVQSYNEAGRTPTGHKNEGFTPPTSSSDVIGAGDGYFVYYQFVKPGVLANTLDINGPLFTGSYSTGTLSHSTGGLLDDRGWHMVGNPYASPVDFGALSISGIANSTGYVKKAGGNYWDIVNDGIDYIYSSEAMWVKVNSGGGSVTFNENDKANVSDDYNARQSQSVVFDRPLKLKLTSPSFNGYEDYSVLRFGGDSNSVNYDLVFGESVKFPNMYGYFPNISTFSLSDSTDVYYNTLNPEEENYTIPIRVYTRYANSSSTNYAVEFEGIQAWNEDNHCLILSDSLNNTSVKLDAINNSYSWTMMDSVKEPVLFLHHSKPITASMNGVSCFGKTDASLSAFGRGGTHTYTWRSSLGVVLKVDSSISVASELNNVGPGRYTVEVTDNGQCGTMSKEFIVEPKERVISDFEIPTEWSLSDGPLQFINTSANAESYLWNFGDGSNSSEIMPTHSYVEPGIYTVNLTAYQNDSCFDVSSKQLTISIPSTIEEKEFSHKLQVYSFERSLFIRGELEIEQPLRIQLFNSMGQEVLGRFTSRSSIVSEQIEVPFPAGIYIVRITSTDFMQTIKVMLR